MTNKAMSEQFDYKSPLAPYMRGLVSVKNAMGLAWLRGKWILLEFDRFYMSEKLETPTITQDVIDRWRLTRAADSHRTLYAKYNVWSQLARYMNRNGAPCYVPQTPKCPGPNLYAPYIFSPDQMERIFDESLNLRPNNSSRKNSVTAIPALIRFLYSTGVRISEALSICNIDLHLDKGYIHLRKTKNGHERLVAVNDSMRVVLEQYISFRNTINERQTLPEGKLFVKADGTPIKQNAVYCWFKTILKRCGIPHMGNHHGPRVHDLRHTGACHSLAAMARQGKDLYAILPVLQEWLGHRSVDASERYLRLTADMYPDLREKMEIIENLVNPDMPNEKTN